MDNLLNKAIMLTLCFGLMVITGVTVQALTGMLVAISLTAFFELPRIPYGLQRICPWLYCTLTLFIPSFVIFLPLAAADLYRFRRFWIRLIWLVPIIVLLIKPAQVASPVLEAFIVVTIGCFCLLSCLLSWRALRIAEQQEALRIERDKLSQSYYNLELRNRDLVQLQDLEREMATLDERSRIAREIHDNAGHLLTRSILQIKALEVTFSEDELLMSELQQISETLDSAFDTVRKSVHDLYEQSSSLDTQLEALTKAVDDIDINVEYRCVEMPAKLASSLLAIIHEALSNTQRHSDASRIRISLVEFPGLYQLVVQDNGSVDPGENLEQTFGLGLTSMADRARAMGGIFRISYDHGFTVFVSIPKA